MAAISQRITQGSARAGSSPSPTPCDLRYLIILTQPASPRLCQHSVKPAGKGGGESRRERAPIPPQRLRVPVGWGSRCSCSRCW